MERLIAAWRFLTIVPIPGRWGRDQAALGSSLPFFPVVGLAIGGSVAGLAVVLEHLFPPLLVAVLLVAALLAVSGGLHMDGLSDTADGLFSARPRERMLEIMRDSRVGAMGVMAIVLVLLLKVAALAAVPAGKIWLPVLLMPLAGRVVLVLLTAFMPYARPEGGLATLFYRQPARLAAAWALGFLVLACWLAAGFAGLYVVVAVLAGTLIIALFCRRKIGGVTGDTLGAACEAAEAIVAVTLAAQPLSGLWGL